jgi:hypothetical protein
MKGMYLSARRPRRRCVGGRAPFYLALLGKVTARPACDKALDIAGVRRDAEPALRGSALLCVCLHGLGERERALLHQEDAT